MVEGPEVSREELDVLLGKERNSTLVEEMTERENVALKGAYGDSTKAIATSLAANKNQEVDITTPQVSTTSPENIKSNLPKEAIVVDFEYKGGGISGPTYVIFGKDQGALIADLMMGGGGESPPEVLNELYLSALGEALGQMITSSTKTLSTTLGKAIKASEPKIKVVKFPEGISELPIMYENKVTEVKSNFRIGNSDGTLLQILPVSLAKPMVAQQVGSQESFYDAGSSPALTGVHPVQFGTLKPPAYQSTVPSNIGLIEDVPLEITVELGRTKKIVKDNKFKINKYYKLNLKLNIYKRKIINNKTF